MTNSRNKGASFEREIANLLNNDLKLKNSLKRILEQTREKYLPDLILGRWYIYYDNRHPFGLILLIQY